MQCLQFSPCYRHGIVLWHTFSSGEKPLICFQLHGYQTVPFSWFNPLTPFFSLHWERSIHSHMTLSLYGSFLPSVVLVTKLEDQQVLQVMAWIYSCASAVSSSWSVWLWQSSALFIEIGGEVQDCYSRMGEGITNKILQPFFFLFKKVFLQYFIGLL